MVEPVSLSILDLARLAWKAAVLFVNRSGPLEVMNPTTKEQSSGMYLVRIPVRNWSLRKKTYSTSCIRLGDYGVNEFAMSWSEESSKEIELHPRQGTVLNVAFCQVGDQGPEVSPIWPGRTDPRGKAYDLHTARAMAEGRLTMDIVLRPQRRRSRKLGLEITYNASRGFDSRFIEPC